MNSPRVALQAFCRFASGGKLKLTKGDYVAEGFPAFSAAGQDGFVSKAEYDVPGVVVSAIGARCGKSFLAVGKWTTLANTYAVLPDTTVCDPSFLWYQLNDENGWIRSGTAQPFIKPSDIKTRTVLLPPISEQRRIVEILDRADALRKRAREADAKAARILPALFLKMFGDPAINPIGWPDEPLAKLCNPKQWPTISTRELKDSGFPVYGANGQIGFYDTYNHEHATVLITCRGATCGTVGVCAPKSYVTGNAMALDDPDPEKTSIEFLKWFLRMRGLNDTITGSAQPQITRASLKPVRVWVVPKKLVNDFSRQVREIESLEKLCANARTDTEALFSMLLSRGFAGHLTAKWREAHMQELLAEMQEQARLLNLPMPA